MESKIQTYDVDIVSELYFSPAKRLGEIRSQFNNWSTSELEQTFNSIYYSTTADEGVEEPNYFGEKSFVSYHPYRESLLSQTHADSMWSLCSRKKKFF